MSGPLKLKAWRESRDLSFTAAAKLVSVTHPCWMSWEADRTVPELPNAMELEKLTDGSVRIEDWGYARAVDMMGEILARRAADPDVSTSPTPPPPAPEAA